ncbi:MAG: hypothetical protein AAF618_12190 [Pseudomonadota bacterium]
MRQPWAWAIVAGFKKIENRSAGSIAAGGMDRRRIAIHAAQGLKEDEFRWGHWRLHKHGVRCPHPTELPRSAIIGAVDVVDIVSESDSEWFGGQMGLVLENAEACEPIPAPGALGYFEWRAGGTLAEPTRWMQIYDRPGGDEATFDLFSDLPPSFATDPERPRRKR